MWFGEKRIIFMTFEWNENKRLLNLQRHGFDFVRS